MSESKKFTPKEAAIAVLKKAEELYKASTLSKAEKPLEKKHVGFKAVEESAAKSGASDPAAVAAAVGMKKYGKKRFEEHAHEGKKFGKSDKEGHNPDAKADAKLGEKVEQDVQQHEASNEDPAHREKGSYKLAKFVGKMEMKKSQKAKEMGKGDQEMIAQGPSAAAAPMGIAEPKIGKSNG